MRRPQRLRFSWRAVCPCLLGLCAALLLAPATASAQAAGPPAVEPPVGESPVALVPQTSPVPLLSADGEPVQIELARMRAELAALTKALTSWQETERRLRRREGWFEARRDEQRRLRVGPSAGFLVSGGLLLIAGVQLLALRPDDFAPIAAPLVVAGGLLAVTGIVTLTRLLRKRRAIEREIEAELRRPLPR